MKSVLVTGATGFVASHLLPLLHQQGWQITAALRRPFRQRPSIPLNSVTVGEIDGQTRWEEALQGVDAVVHLAARAHILRDDAPNPEAEFRRVNVEGTANLVRQAIAAGVQHFILISSIGAMATLSCDRLNENSPCRPDTPYGRSKLQAERALVDLARDSCMTWTILRPTLVYGAGNPGNLARLLHWVDRGFPLPFASINNRRSFLFVGNLTDAIALCLTHPGAIGQTFLISDGQDVSTPQLIRLIAAAAGKPCRLVPVPPRLLKHADRVRGAIARSLPSNPSTLERVLGSLSVDGNRIRTALNWQPPFTLERGLAESFGEKA